MALRRSPIDNAGLSRVHEAYDGRGSGIMAEGGTSSTLVFQHSASRGIEGAIEGLPVGDDWSGHSLGVSESGEETKAVRGDSLA